MPRLDPERVAVVTGGTGALGRWVVRELAAAGMRVRVPEHTPGTADGVRAFLDEELGEEGSARVDFRPGSVTDADGVAAYFGGVMNETGRIDILVNGVGGFAMAPVEETDPETWRRMMELNADSAFLSSRAVVPTMKERGWGRILNVASFPALERDAAGMSAYAASKAALVNLTRSLADELLEHGITVNAVVPRIIDTPANRAAMPDADRSGWLAPAEIARVLTFLAGDAAGIVTGAAIPLEKG